MKSKDLQKTVLSKYQNSATLTKNYREFNGEIDLRTIKRWYHMIFRSGSITLSSTLSRLRLTRTKENIKKVKYRLCRKKKSIPSKTIDGV